MPAEIFSLPLLGKHPVRTEWRLDARGLEWTQGGKDRWMPFACVRRATLGQSTRGWRLRLSGPPGAVMFGTGRNASSEDFQVFRKLASRMIEGASAAGCRVQFRLNHSAFGPSWLWALGGVKQESGQSLLVNLPKLA